MILDKEIEIKVNIAQVKHFKSIGLDVKAGDVIKIKPEQLSEGSNVKVLCKCDVCGKEKKLNYKRYLRSKNNGGYYTCSPKCALDKTKKTFLDKYGTEHHFQSESTKNKIKKTFLDKYGTEHFSHSEEYKLKVGDITKKRKETIYDSYKKSENILDVNVTGNTFTLHCSSCDKQYDINRRLYHNRKRSKINTCTICYPPNSNVSVKELEVGEFIDNHYSGEIKYNHRLSNKELDIFLPELGLGIEFNGLHWHNETNRPNDYHLEKTKFFEKNNIQLIHIYEDDWDDKREIVKSRLLNLIGGSKRLYARKCKIKHIPPSVYRDFCEKNHTQGPLNSKVKIGLFYDNELVSVMGFGKLRKSLGSTHVDDVWELHRFCNKLNLTVVGGSSKLFKHFLKTYKPKKIISYADRSWSMGGMYEKLGFELVSETKPNYYYIINKKRFNRYNFRKDKLVSEGYDPKLTEKQIMLDRGVYRIYDSGSLKYLYNKKP